MSGKKKKKKRAGRGREKKDEGKRSSRRWVCRPTEKMSRRWVCRPTAGETQPWVSPAVGLDELVPDVLGTAAPDDDDEDDDDDGRSDPNNDCRRFAITKTLKDLRISAVKHLGLFFDFFFFFF
jgi:hypothetical protein